MKKILILAMMTLLFAVIALSTTGNFFWVTSTFGTPTSLFSNSQGGGSGDAPNPNVNPPFPPGDPSNWAVFATGGNNPDNPGGVFAFSGQGQSGGIHPHPQNNGGKVGTNANAKIGNQYPVDFGNKNATITPASDFYFGVGTTDKPALVSGTGAEAFAAAAHILKSYQTFDLPEWRDFTQNSYKSLFTKYDTIPDTLVTGYYQNLEISNNGTKNITVSASDVIILIDNLTIGNNGKISVTRNGNGRLFFLVTTALSGKGEIEVKQDGTPLTYDDKSFLFYNGASGFSNNQTFDIDFPGIVFLESGEFNISNDSKQTIGGIVSRGEGDIDSTGANISALVYAPLADLKYGGNGDIEGTVIAKNIELKGNSGIRYKLIPIPKPEIPEPPVFEPPTFLIAAVDNGGYNPRGVYTSTDGITWTKRPNGQYEMYGPRSVTGSDSMYIVAGLDGYGKFGSSPDGITWTPADPGYSNIYSVRWLNGRFVAVGQVGDGGISVSTNGTSWESKSTYGYGVLRDVAWGDGLYIAIGAKDSNGIYWSETGAVENWSYRNNSQEINGITYGNGLFVAVGPKKIQTITKTGFKNNNSWTDRSPNGNYTLNRVAWSGSLFVAVGNSGVIYTSPDGTTWTKQTSPTSAKLNDVQWVPSIHYFYAAGNEIVLKSPDGITWTAIQPKNPEGSAIESDFKSIFGR